jgi:catalase
MHTLQQDGHMAFHNPIGRANYEPNSWGGAQGGPREAPELGFRTVATDEQGPKVRLRAESFADHYSQAHQFYVSQMEVEREHIAAAFTFELSKVETPAIRVRMVAQLRNVDEELAQRVCRGLGLASVPDAAPAARPTRRDLKPSPALSILRNGPKNLSGRRLGILVTNGADADLLTALRRVMNEEGAMVKLIAPQVGGVQASDGSRVAADEKLDGAPSVLFDAIAILASNEGCKLLLEEATARDFIADAFAHMKIIGYVPSALALLHKAGLEGSGDSGVIELTTPRLSQFVQSCRQLRIWERFPKVKQI